MGLLLLVLLWKFLHTAAAATVTDILLLYILENSPSAQPHSHGALHALCFPRDFPQNNSTLLHLDSLGSCFPLFFFSILDPRRFSSIRFLSETRKNRPNFFGFSFLLCIPRFYCFFTAMLYLLNMHTHTRTHTQTHINPKKNELAPLGKAPHNLCFQHENPAFSLQISPHTPTPHRFSA